MEQIETYVERYALADFLSPELKAAIRPFGTTLLVLFYRQLARVMRRFREEGILEKRRGGIVVADREKLEPLARDYYL